jgi:hypothetical protein
MMIQIFTDRNETSTEACKMLDERMIVFQKYETHRHKEVCRNSLLRSGSSDFPVLRAGSEKESKSTYVSGLEVLSFIRDLEFGG